MSTFLIAEISNHHLGSIHKAKELIRIAKESGADAVKSQAFKAIDMLKWGKMPLEFYEQCEFTFREYKQLIEYGKEIGIPVFFTVLSGILGPLKAHQKYRKLHAADFEKSSLERLKRFDRADYFISMKAPRQDLKEIRDAKILYATEYLQDADVDAYEAIAKFYERPIGISHHSKFTYKLLQIRDNYVCPWVEKHFYLGGEVVFKGQTYRDCLHSSMPSEFENLKRLLER